MGSGGGDSAVKTILIGVVLALAVGGSAPWWWTSVFKPKPVIPADPIEKKPVAGLGACSDGSTPSGDFHDAAATNGSWDWNCDGQVEKEYTVCENLTRAQCDPNTNAAHGPPGFCSELRAPGGCTPKVASCGLSGYIYPCFYDAADGRCHAGGYETATVMRCR